MTQSLLSLRPSNVLHRLNAGSTVPIMGIREFFEKPNEIPPVLLSVPVSVPLALPGILLAARHAEVPICLGMPFRPGDRTLAERFFKQVEDETARVSHHLPIVLQGGPIRVGRETTFLQMSEDVFRYLDGGATLISLDAARLELEQQPKAYSGLLSRSLAIEFCLEVAAPLTEYSMPSAERLAWLLSALREDNIRVDFVRIASWQLVPPVTAGAEVNLGLLAELVETAKAFGARISIEDSAHDGATAATAWAEAKVAKVDAWGVFSEILFRQIDPDERTLWKRRGWPLGLTGAEWMALRPDVGEDLSLKAQQRLEATFFAETSAWIEALNGRGWRDHLRTLGIDATGAP